MKVILEMLSYPFLVRALVVGVLVSLCASLLGVSLVLKRYSMIGDRRSSKNAATTTTGTATASGARLSAVAIASAPKPTWLSPSPIME